MKIGFVDYYLSEWHANNYPAWIAELDPSFEIAYAWAELDRSPNDGVTSEEWCQKYGATLCATLEELCERSDAIFILSPDDPDRHLPYARTVFSYRKPTYVDKTFAPDLATAKEIFAIAAQYGTPFFSASSLRFAKELKLYEGCREMMVMGAGANFEVELIHPIEMVVTVMGQGARRVKTERFGAQTHVHIGYDDGRCANMMLARSLPYAVYLSDGTAKGPRPVTATVDPIFFKALMADILRFFQTLEVSFDTAETLEVIRLRDGILASLDSQGSWLEI